MFEMNIEITLAEDELREAMIWVLKIRFLTAKTNEERQAIWEVMKSEINARSPEKIARMEREKGLSD